MAANEFEKSVRKIMDDLKLHPSEEGWQKVEERIRDKNRKRRILFFLFSLLGLAIVGSLLYVFSSTQNWKLNDSTQNSNHKQTPNNTQNSTPENEVAKINPTGQVTRHQDAMKVETIGRKADRQTNPAPHSKKTEGGFITDKAQPSQGDPSDRQQVISHDSENQRIVATQTDKPTEANTAIDTAVMKVKENKPGDQAAQIKGLNKHDQNFRKVKWGLNISGGMSTIRENRLFTNNTSVSPAYFANAPNTVGGGSQAPYSMENKPGFAFKTGVSLKRNISKRSALSSGLNYTYFSDKIKIGTQQTGTLQSNRVSSYYAGPPQEDFTDKFHFLELPILYSWRITSNTNHFLALDAGISVSYLISSNALVYDTAAGGIYYHNNDLLTRTHFNVLSGISYHAISAKGSELSIGPQFLFDMSKAIKSEVDKRNYFLYIGIGGSLIFEKKKK